MGSHTSNTVIHTSCLLVLRNQTETQTENLYVKLLFYPSILLSNYLTICLLLTVFHSYTMFSVALRHICSFTAFSDVKFFCFVNLFTVLSHYVSGLSYYFFHILKTHTIKTLHKPNFKATSLFHCQNMSPILCIYVMCWTVTPTYTKLTKLEMW
jgi:hypothetical protein